MDFLTVVTEADLHDIRTNGISATDPRILVRLHECDKLWPFDYALAERIWPLPRNTINPHAILEVQITPSEGNVSAYTDLLKDEAALSIARNRSRVWLTSKDNADTPLPDFLKTFDIAQNAGLIAPNNITILFDIYGHGIPTNTPIQDSALNDIPGTRHLWNAHWTLD